VFRNAVVFNPTQPVTLSAAITTGAGLGVVRNPVALANQITTWVRPREPSRTARRNSICPGLDGTGNVGWTIPAAVASSTSQRQSPRRDPGRWARAIYSQDNNTKTVQTLLTYRRQVGESHSFDVVGGYEWSEFRKTLAMVRASGS